MRVRYIGPHDAVVIPTGAVLPTGEDEYIECVRGEAVEIPERLVDGLVGQDTWEWPDGAPVVDEPPATPAPVDEPPTVGAVAPDLQSEEGE